MTAATSSLLSADELAGCWSLQRQTMVDSCQIRRPTRTSDGMGGSTVSWSTVATVACRVGKPQRSQLGTERVISDRLAGETLMMVTFPHGTDVRRTDQLQVDNGVTYDALSVLAPTSFETARQVLCKVVT